MLQHFYERPYLQQEDSSSLYNCQRRILILLIEKFRDPEIAEIYKKFFIDIPIQYQIKIFKKLQKNGLMIQGNAQVFAMELYSPFYLYHFVEFEPEKLFPLLRKHVEYFLEGHMIHK